MTDETAYLTQVSKRFRSPNSRLLETTALACIAVAVTTLPILVHPSQALAQSSTWTNAPIDNNYNNHFNWLPNGVPNTAVDTAIFGQSNMTNLVITNTVSVDRWSFNADADNYFFTSDQRVMFYGEGITIDGGTQMIINSVGGELFFLNNSGAGNVWIANDGTTLFTHNSSAENASILNESYLDFYEYSSAANATITTSGGGITHFHDASTASDAYISTDAASELRFSAQSSAADAVISNYGTLTFEDSATAGNAEQITNNFVTNFLQNSSAGSANITNEGLMWFRDSSTAEDAMVLNAWTLELTDSASLGNATVSNASAIEFYGDSTASDSIIVNNGALEFYDNSTAGSATITNNGDIYLVDNASLGTARYIGDAVGTLEIGGLTSPGARVGSIAGEGQINMGTKTLRAGGNDLSTEFSGVITGTAASSLIKEGAGVLILSGTSLYSGATYVDTGSLIVNGSIADSAFVSINNGTLGGVGTVATVFALGNSTVAPGNSIGTLNVAGDVTFNAGSVYEVELNSAGQSDLIDATGTATLNGGTVEVVPFPDFALDTQYTIVTAAGGVNGMFDGTDFASPFLTPALSYGANDVFLTIAQTADFDSAALTPNQIAAAGGAQSLGGGDLFNAIALLGTEEEARAAFDAISGETHASAKTALLEDSRFIREIANARLRTGFGDAAGEGVEFWAHGFGATGRTNGDGNAATLDRSIGGLLVGADGEVLDNWRFGLLTGYSHSNFDVDDRASSGSADSYHLGAYGGTQWQNWALRFGGAYSRHDIDIGRTAAFTGFSDGLSSSYSASTGQLFGELGYGMDVGAAHLEPFANLAWVNHATDDFTESGGAAALTSVDSNTDATFATLGLRIEAAVTLGEVNAKVKGMVGYRHAFADEPTSTHSFVAGGDAFTVAGVPIASDTLVLDAGVDLDIAPNVALGLAYSGQFGSGIRDHAARAHLNVKF